MKYKLFMLVTFVLMAVACNDDWDREQYKQYVSLKARVEYGGVTRIRFKYNKDNMSVYRLPVIVSGTLTNDKDLDVHIGIDPDTLRDYNEGHYNTRTELYYQELKAPFYEIPNPVVHIPAGENQGWLNIHFNPNGLDLSEKWILPLIVKDDPSYNYESHPRKNYNNAMLWITPFNDYSGKYGTTNLSIYTDKTDKPIVLNEREAYVVDDESIFFYAGTTKETRKDRRSFKIKATFVPQTETTGTISLEAEYPEIINFKAVGESFYYITEVKDTSRPSLLRRTVTINLEYYYDDPLETPNYTIRYHVKGTMSMQRNINTLILPDEEFAIEWD